MQIRGEADPGSHLGQVAFREARLMRREQRSKSEGEEKAGNGWFRYFIR